MSDPLCRYSDISGEFVLGGEEDAGTKDKFWLARKSDAAEFLFKIGRIDSENNAVENWAEAAAAELCEKLGVPHAPYRLVVYNKQRGTISEDFRRWPLPDGKVAAGEFWMANELLGGMRQDYPVEKRGRVKEYTVDACVSILRMMEKLEHPLRYTVDKPCNISLPGLFCGYLMLDALIANSDRHHENWGFLVAWDEKPPRVKLAPTFDHASSFCREVAEKVRERLNTKDKERQADAFCRSPKAKSAFCDKDGRPFSPLEAFKEAMRLAPEKERNMWLDKLEKLNPRRDLTFAFGDHCDAVAPESREFALQMVEVNRGRLLELRK